MTRVDVVIPCYRYAHFLRACVDSVLSQPGVDVRVLILDDASPDDTPAVAGELTRRDPRVEYRRHETNQGHIATYNEGLLGWASGDCVLLLSADDLLAPGALRRAARVLEEHPEVGLVHGRQVFFGDEPGPAQTPEDTVSCPTVVLAGEAFVETCCTGGSNPVATPTAVVRTALQHEAGGYSKALPHTADMELWLRLAARSSVARVEAHQAYKRMHAANMQHEYVRGVLADLRQRQGAFESFFQGDGRRLAGRDRLQALAARRLGEAAFWAASRAFDRGDGAACRPLLEYAVQLAPGLASGREWARLRWKRRLGTRAWRVVRPLVERLRGRAAAQAR
jgi:glycosyltransferase involved in cell wall biosynthesis